MTNAKDMIGIFQDLDIEYSDWTENPKEFAKRLRDKAHQLDAQLKEKNTVLDLEERFKAKAFGNREANDRAEEFISYILDQIAEMDVETQACVLTRLPEVTQTIAKTIRVTSMRQERTFSRKRVHMMYNKLRKAYETYVSFMSTFRPEDIGKPPMIPARPGNYASDHSSIKEYIFWIDGKDYVNYYTAARILGQEITHYTDLVDFFQEEMERAEKTGESQYNLDLTIVGDDE